MRKELTLCSTQSLQDNEFVLHVIDGNFMVKRYQ